MDQIRQLLQILREDSKFRSSDPVKRGLNEVHRVIRSGIEIGAERWSREQIEATIEVFTAVVRACFSIPVDRAEPVMIAILGDSIELCTCLLEKSTLRSDDFSFQSTLIELLEIMVVDGKFGNRESCKIAEDTILQSLPIPPNGSDSMESEFILGYNPREIGVGLESQNSAERVFKVLSSEGFPGHIAHSSHISSSSILCLSRQWAITHVKCLPRLLRLLKDQLYQLNICGQQAEDAMLYLNLSLSSKILNFLVKLTDLFLVEDFDPDLLHTIAAIADTLPKLFKKEAEISECETSSTQNSLGGLFLTVLEDFLHVVKVISCNSIVYLNVRVSMVANILRALDSSLWRYDISGSSVRSPVIYFPQIVMHLLKLIGEVKNQRSQLLDPNECNFKSQSFSCHVDSDEVFLLRRYTVQEHLMLLFPSSRLWVDNLLHLAYFLHAEGSRSRIKRNVILQVCSKSNVSEPESTASQEDDAIFGNLFSEAFRTTSSLDGGDQLSLVVPGASSGLPSPFISTTCELLNFLKSCIFSRDWDSSVFTIACKQLNEQHIDYLLSMLLSQSHPDDRSSPASNGFSPQGMLSHANEICLRLFYNLLEHNALPSFLEECLVDKILMVRGGKYVYNDWTLSLLASCFISNSSSRSSKKHLIGKLFESYCQHIIERTNCIFSGCPGLTELCGALPTIFHIEILLIAFHLADEAERPSLVKGIILSLGKINRCPEECSSNQLSCWGLLVSRLILVLRYLVFHPGDCPSWLLLRLKWRLGAFSSLHKSGFSLNFLESYSSWAPVDLVNILGDHMHDLPAVNAVLPHLIDVAAFSLPASFSNISDCFQLLDIDNSELVLSFSSILDMWSGRQAETVEDMLLERYLFMLCWDTCLRVGSFGVDLKLEENSVSTSSLMPGNFLSFGKLLINLNSVTEKIIKMLPLLYSKQRLATDMGWDFLRNESMLSLLLYLLNTGVWVHFVRQNRSNTDLLMESNPMDGEFFNASEGTVIFLTESDKIGWLLGVLSSSLKHKLHVLLEAFVSVLDGWQSGSDKFSFSLLIKHVLAYGRVQSDLLDRFGSSKTSRLNSMARLLANLEEISAPEISKLPSQILSKCMVHGFPFHSSVHSGFLLSSALSVRDIILAIDGFLRLKPDIISDLDGALVHEILESVITVKSDVIFRSIHGKCDSIFSCISERLSGDFDYLCLYELKHLLGILSESKCQGEIAVALLETLTIATLEKAEGLRINNARANIFEYFLGTQLISDKENGKPLAGNSITYLAFFTALENCSENVNIKVLQFFVDILAGSAYYPRFKESLQRMFLTLDSSVLSLWLEKRLLGRTEESSGVVVSKASSELSKVTMNFLSHLTSLKSEEVMSRETRDRFVEAMLLSLDRAFTLYDIDTAKSFFTCLVQFLGGESSSKLFLEKVIILIEVLAERQDLMQHLKFLFSFLGAVLGGSDVRKSTTNKTLDKPSSSCFSGVNPSVSRQISRTTDPLTSCNQETESANMECDATSGEEDEDDGTSDGDLAGIDKEEEDDSNSERSLASQLCTFTSSGNNFMEQHWYFCYTCDLTVSKGCCSVCAKVCHRGHRVVYSRSSRFFCDCGAGGVRGSSCQCLKPRKTNASRNAVVRSNSGFKALLPFSEDGDQSLESDSDLDSDALADTDCSLEFSIPGEMISILPTLLSDIDAEKHVLGFCSKLAHVVAKERDCNLFKDKKVVLCPRMKVSLSNDVFQLKKTFKSGSFDLKVKVDYANSRDLKSHLSSGLLVKSLLSVSSRGRLAVGEGDKVAIFDASQLIGQTNLALVTADKSNVKPLHRSAVRFEIVHLLFNPIAENYLAVAGYEECHVLTLNSRGEVTDRLAIELALQHAYIRRVDWVPGSQVHLMVVTNVFVKIFNLSQDGISPAHCFTVKNDTIMDASFVSLPMGRLCLLVLSKRGSLFRMELSLEGDAGEKSLTQIVDVHLEDLRPKGRSLYFSYSHRLLFLSYQDDTTLVGRLDAAAKSLVKVSKIYEEDDKPAGLHHWRELFVEDGIFACFSSFRSNAPLSVSFDASGLVAQNMRYLSGPVLPLVGLVAYKPLSKDKSYCLILQDDGSLQIYCQTPETPDVSPGFNLEKAKKIGAGLLSSKAHSGMNTDFPLDFFEKTTCVTADVRLSGDGIRNGDSEAAKQRLQSEDGFLESPSLSGFKILVSNSNPDVTVVGIRVQVGNTSVNHIPSEIGVFQRQIKLDEGMRAWYDIPFTTSESLLSDEDFAVSIGPTYDGTSLPRIDSLEVYSQPKDEFGWKQKMEAVLKAETHALGHTMTSARKKFQGVIAASVQEQILADALNLLAKLYSSYSSWNCSVIDNANLELGRLKCRDLLETVFQTDSEKLILAAASHVLKAIIPRKESYYHVKDTMRLLGVISSLPKLRSKIDAGSIGASLVKEFTMQLRAVSRIAFLRRFNLVSFLEAHGSQVVDGLMDVLWGILDLERPDPQTINSIVIPTVDLIYCYVECLALDGLATSGQSVDSAVVLLKKLLFAPYEMVRTACSLALSSRLLQVPIPKQTILSMTDDPAENPSAAKLSSDASTGVGGNTQVSVEEDGNLSSVQYCCDGCSTVPILRRRWHCNICPDFDLCETCYELLDSDQLPPPHSKDHPMTAIPIELDHPILTGDEPFDASPNVTAADTTSQNSAAPIHVLESAPSADFLAQNQQRFFSISASKKAVNSLLLQQLITQIEGWMRETSGLVGIPIMQLFYRLFSGVIGPFMDSSLPESLDLEKVVRWFLDEIDLEKPFVAKERTRFGEIMILVFMFLTLMLRNWHQPGTDGSQAKPGETQQEKGPLLGGSFLSRSGDDQEKNEFASQLSRACSSLRQQSFVNYLMDILLQLVPEFKSSTGNNEENTHGLLTIRKDIPAGNFLPFFSDSYAKAHKIDLFADYHRLLLENTFRVVYSLIRPEKHDKSVSREKTHHQRNTGTRELRLDGYQDILCSYICNPNTAFVRRYARRLLLHLCGSKTQYYQVRDSWQFSNEVRELYRLGNESDSFQGPLSYEENAKLVKCLSALAEAAGARPRHWQKFCIKNEEILRFLADTIFYFGEESVILALKLLTWAFYTSKESSSSAVKTEGGDITKLQAPSIDPKKKMKGGDAGNETSSERLCLDMEQSVTIFYTRQGGSPLLQRVIDTFLLGWNSASLRSETKALLFGLWHHGKEVFQEILLSVLLDKVSILPMYGQNSVEFIELLISLLGRPHSSDLISVDKCLKPDVISCIFKTLHSQNELLANHPNSRIYGALSGLVEFDGYYLESDPCIACSCPEAPYSRMKLETLKSETKFTDNRIIVKCTGSHAIQSVTMNVHDARKSRSVKVLNLHYNNNPLADLSELKNNWGLWKQAKSCHLGVNQTELKVEFPIPITACNFMIELDSFYENLQASSLESLQCPRCSRVVTDKHGICSHCHENAYQCRQCRNINYENLNSFLCNECGYSKYGRFEFHFMAKSSFTFDEIGSDEEMRKVLAAIESESENAHRRYQQLLGFKKPLLKLISSVGEPEPDSPSQHTLKDTVQQMIASLPGPSSKINRKIALLGVLYGEKCKAAFDSVSKSVQMLQGLRKVLMNYLSKKKALSPPKPAVSGLPKNCYGCAATFTAHCMELLQVLSKNKSCRRQLVALGVLPELFENNIHQGSKTVRSLARAVLCTFSEGDGDAVDELNRLIQRKVMYCLEHHRSMDVFQAIREELLLLSETCSLVDEFWESRLRVAFKLLFSSIKHGAKHPAISEYVILPSLRIVSQACTPPKTDDSLEKQEAGKAIKKVDKEYRNKDIGVPLLSYSEWERGASYLDFVRRQSRFSKRSISRDNLALKYAIRWKQSVFRRTGKSEFSSFELGSWASELILSACSHSIRVEVCSLFTILCPDNSSRQFQLLSLLMNLLPASLAVGDNATEYFELFFKMIESEPARLFLTARGFLATLCNLITEEVNRVESQERRLNIDISQGFVLHKLVELLSKFLEIAIIRVRFMRAELISQVLEALLVLRGLIVQKTKLISDCNRLLKELIDGLLLESPENKRLFTRACISALELHSREPKGRTSLFILEQLRNVICPTKPEPVYLLNLYKAHTQEEFIRGSMTKKPYSSKEIGPLMRDVKNKICNQLDLIGLLDDDYGMELLVAGNIISLDLTISQVYEQVWKKSPSQSQSTATTASASLSSSALPSGAELPPMAITYRLQGLDGEATEPMIKELEEDREESLDPEVEFAITGAVRECGGLEVILAMIQRLSEEGLKSNEEELISLLNLLTYCCKIRENRQALLQQGALGLLLETARRAFSADAMEPAEGVLLIVESLSVEANDSNLSVTFQAATAATSADEEAKKIVLMFLERLSHKRHRNREMVARILPYLTYGEPAAMETLLQHFVPHLLDWPTFDRLGGDEGEEDEQKVAVENFVHLTESLRTSSSGDLLKDMIVDKGIVAAAVRHLLEIFPEPGGEGLKLPSAEAILAVLRGVCRGHRRAQAEITAAPELLPLLHALERIPGGSEVAARAENLLDTLADDDGFLGDPVRRLRLTTREELRRRALLKRQELLKGMGMKQEVGKIVVMARPSIMEEVEEEEEGLACMVCREGYSLRPGDALGAYTYTKRVSLGGTTRSSGGDLVYTTVSHFNVIHFQCHQEAKKADAALKNPKKEWEGAALRNSETLCNSVFPLKGPALPPAQYARYVDQHWDNLAVLGSADGSRLRLLTYDIVLMLARFATGASFSTDCRGGGKESNARFLPFMIQMAAHLLDQPGPTGPPPQARLTLSRTVSAYLSSSPPTADDESVQFMMVTSLLADSYDDWRQHRLPFLRRGLRHASAQHRLVDVDEHVLFPLLKPILVYLALIDRLQRLLKLPDLRRDNNDESWERVMRARLGSIGELAELSKELLPWLEEMAATEDVQAALDVIGMIPDVIAAGYSDGLAFIKDAVSPQ